MFGWLFGKKKKLNKKNVNRKMAMLTKIEGLSHKQRVRRLRDLKGIHTHVPDFDYMYADDMLEDFIMLYLLMDMVDVVQEEEAGFYEDTQEEVVNSSADVEEIVTEPTPIAVEKTVVEVAPVIEETVAVEEKAETFADNYKVENTSSSFGDSFGSSDSGGGYDSDCGGDSYDSGGDCD